MTPPCRYEHDDIYIMSISIISWQPMPISEERLQLLLPRRLKSSAKERAQRLGLSVGAYVRGLIEADITQTGRGAPAVDFPFGGQPISTGRTRGSVEHDRPE